jgi:photosystem II stability/assembly factor-like uncharacterized protein
VKTRDGGQNWEIQKIDALPAFTFPALYFLNIDMGWIATNGHIYRTNDCAVSWQPQTNPVHYENLNDLQFIDKNHG